jgi:hypothetical protein
MEQKVKSDFEKNIDWIFKNNRKRRIEAYKKEHEKKEIEFEKVIGEQIEEFMEAYYNDLEIDYEALLKALTKNS